MTKWFAFLLRCCKRRRRPRGVHILDPNNQDQDTGVPRPHRRTYYYSIFAVRLAIMVMLAVLIALLTILTWHFTTVYTTKSIKNLAFGLRTELLNRPIARMWNLLNNTVETTNSQVYLTQYVLSQYNLPIDTAAQVEVHKTMRNVTWANFAGRKMATAITVVYVNGQLQAFNRNPLSNQTYYLFTNPLNGTALGAVSTPTASPAVAPDTGLASGSNTSLAENGNMTWYTESVDPDTGKATSPSVVTQSYNLTTDISDVLSLANHEVTWRVTVDDYEDIPLLSSATPIRESGTKTVLAVTGVTMALSSINAFLQQLTLTHSGYLYLTTADGYLLASSTNSSLIDTAGATRGLLLANESRDPVIKAGAQWLNERYGFQGLLDTVVHAEDVKLEGTRFYIDTFSLQLPRLQMVGVIIIPRSYVMGEVDRRGRATLAILIAISSCILIVGCIFILILTSGVSTEMKLRAQLINHLDARRRAEASSSYKSQFLANMSHELRTPMAAVIGLLDILLCDDCLSAEQVNMVSEIRRCSTALLRLLNNILDISKVESGKLQLEEADFDLNRELEGLVDMFSVQCVDHDIEIVLDLADDMPHMVRGDSARTVQIFANLIANSVKFTSSGHVILRGWCGSPNVPATALRTGLLFGKADNTWDHNRMGDDFGGSTSFEPGRLLLWFEVEDTGCGIDPSKWEAVFDSFVQADPSTTRTYGGTGLGLCIVRSLVRKMGGDIKVVKKQGPGTLLRFYLVFRQPSEVEPDTPRMSVPAELENAKVLLALKGDVGRGLLAQWMHFRGPDVYEASEWDEAIRVLNEFSADEHKVSWDRGANHEDFMAPEAGSRKVDRSTAVFPDRQGDRDNADEEVSLVLSGNSGQWKMHHYKLLAVVDSELIPWTEDASVDPVLSVLDDLRDRGVIISWLLNHETPKTLKSHLRRTGYSIIANQPLYKSKLLQLLASMAGSLDRGSSRLKDSDVEELHVKDGGRSKSSYFEDVKVAAIDRHELEKLQSQVQSKLGMARASGSLPKVLESWPSNKTAVNVGNIRAGQTGLALDIIALHRDRERFPVTRENLERSVSFNGRPRDSQGGIALAQQHDEEEMTNLGPLASPGSSSRSSDIESPCRSRPLKAPPVTVGKQFLPTTPPPEQPSVHGDTTGNHVVDIPEVLLDRGNVGLHKLNDNMKRFEQTEKTIQRDQDVGSLSNVSSKPLISAGIADQNHLQHSQSSHKQVGLLAEDYSKIVSEHQGSPSAPGDRTPSLESSAEISSEPALTPPPCRPPALDARPSTRNRLAKRPAARGLGPSNALTGIRILLAEDTPVLQKVATIMLEKMGARVMAVGDGLQAVETIGRSRGDPSVGDTGGGTAPSTDPRDGAVEKFDLVLMDCQMPRMDGYDATKAIRKAEEGKDWHLPIVALTAHAMSSDEAKCLQVGMDAYLTKPIDSKLMVSTILSLTKKGS